MPPRSSLRHCPICGIAMQASKTRGDIEHFDCFECLNCHTTIVEAPGPRRDTEDDGSGA